MSAVEGLSAGDRVANRYEIIRLLGRGAVKNVYLALDLLSRMQVAVALLRSNAEGDRTIGSRFSREARAASVLASPYVVRVFDVGKMADGTRYMVTEAVLGRGLDEAIAYGPAAPMSAALWTAEVLSALSEAHARGVLHRDVKPENVLLAPTEGHPVGERARLTDFGLAKVLDTNLEGSVMLRTAQGVVMGTADYMSPEQWMGSSVDPRADIYSVGAMFHELLVGAAPFTGESLQEVCAQHMTADVRPFPAAAPDAARAFEPIVRRALAKRREERFQSVDEMRDAIERTGGFRLAPAVSGETSDDEGAAFVRAELVTNVGVGPIQLIAAARVVLGRAGHVVLRCVPFSADNDRRGRTISRRHARIEWRGGVAVLQDLRSSTGTSISGRPVDPGSPGVSLQQGDVIALGPHVRLRFEHSPCVAGVLPRWARLVRVDPHGAGLVHLLVLTEADVSGNADAAIQLEAARSLGSSLRIAAVDGHFEVVCGNSPAVPVRDGQSWVVGDAALTFALASERL